MDCIALRLVQGKVGDGAFSYLPRPAHLTLARAERYATHSTVLYKVKHPCEDQTTM